MHPQGSTLSQTSGESAPRQATSVEVQQLVRQLPEGESDIDSLDYFALEGEKARLVIELRERMKSQRAGKTD